MCPKENHHLDTLDWSLGTSIADVGVFRLSALAAPPSGGLGYGASTVPDMNSTIKVLNKLAFICQSCGFVVRVSSIIFVDFSPCLLRLSFFHWEYHLRTRDGRE